VGARPPEVIAWWGAVIYHVLLRVVLLPVVAGLAYEGLRLGARRGNNPLVRAVMKPGLWLQLITTKQPDRDQIEVAIRAFEAVVPAEHREDRVPHTLDSPITLAPHGLPAARGDAASSRSRSGAACGSWNSAALPGRANQVDSPVSHSDTRAPAAMAVAATVNAWEHRSGASMPAVALTTRIRAMHLA
jgi:hypothetical protein